MPLQRGAVGWSSPAANGLRGVRHAFAPILAARARGAWSCFEDPAIENDKTGSVMKKLIAAFLLCLAPLACLAASPAQEKQFVDAYKKAYEGKDGKSLQSMLYTKGADPQALEFYKMMLTAEMGGKIASIELLDLTADDKAKSAKMAGPDGKPMKLVLPPTKKLVIKAQTSDKNGSSSSTSQVFVGESDGKLYVLVPAAAK
jgi:hypothetical protein